MYHEPSEGKTSESRKDYVASSLLISLALIIIVLLEIFDPKMRSLTMFSLERRDLLPLIALTALRPNSRELHQGRVRAAILLVAGVILIILGFMSLPLKYPLIPMNNVALSLTLIIGGFFVMALAAYVDRAESRWYYLPLQSILFVAGVGLMLASLMLFPFILIHSTSPPTMEEQTLIVELSLILFIAGIFVMLLGFYVDRARSRRGHYIRPESPSKK